MNPIKLIRPGGLHILLYHRVLPEPDPLRPYDPTLREFIGQMRVLKRFFQPIALGEGVRRLREGDLPARSVAVTFDDGYRDNLTGAAPVLASLGVPATVFVAPGFSDGRTMWNDQIIEAIRRLPDAELDLEDVGLGVRTLGHGAERYDGLMALLRDVKYLEPAARDEAVAVISDRCGYRGEDGPMLTETEIRTLHRRGITIGAHTVNHPILSRTDTETARHEIQGSKQALEQIIDAPVTLFAYPNGKPGEDYTARDIALAEAAGFDFAFSTRGGLATGDAPRFEMPRFGLWSQHPLRYGVQISRRFAA